MAETFANILLWAVPVLFAITVRAVAYAYVAHYLGDTTPERLGRMSLNPLKHISIIGTIIIPLVLYFGTNGGFAFGWAKPLPVDFSAFKDPKRSMIWLALSGPAANLGMILIWGLALSLASQSQGDYAEGLAYMAVAGIAINVILCLFNLLPIPPLDGGRILMGLLPNRLSIPFSRIEPYSMFILLGLLATNVLNGILGSTSRTLIKGIISLFISQ